MIPVTISPEAISEIKDIFDNKNIPDGYALRLTVDGGGCAGVSHKLGFDKPSTEDLIYTEYGFDVCIAKKDLMHLIGMNIAFLTNSEEQGFVFEKG